MSNPKILTPGKAIKGNISIPGDKSISHRALILGALAEGITSIRNIAPSYDCISTLKCLKKLGIEIEESAEKISVIGKGLYGIVEPADILDAENSGTTMRLMAGILSGQEGYFVITGDNSLRNRPMARIIKPLREMGAIIFGRSNDKYAPLTIKGANLIGTNHYLPVASAQLKSALLLAGLLAEGTTTVTEPSLSRDHTERMLRAMGVDIKIKGLSISIEGGQKISAKNFNIPGDFSSATFIIAAAIITPNSEVVIENVGINPTRTGLLDVFIAMGADLEIRNQRDLDGEPIGDIIARSSSLTGTIVEGEIIPRLIDEIPILAVVATQAKGITIIRNAEELRFKESDRINAISTELQKMGANIEPTGDGLKINGPNKLIGTYCNSYGDHRIAMALTIASLIAENETTLDNMDCVNISFPKFLEVLQSVKIS